MQKVCGVPELTVSENEHDGGEGSDGQLSRLAERSRESTRWCNRAVALIVAVIRGKSAGDRV